MSGIRVFADDSYKLGSRTTLDLGLRFDTSKGYFAALPILDQAGQPTGQTSPAMERRLHSMHRRGSGSTSS